MYKNLTTLLLLTAAIGGFARLCSAQEAMPAPAEAVAPAVPAATEEEITVEEGQIKIPIRNPFVPRFPITIEEEPDDAGDQLIVTEDTTQVVKERRIEYVEPKITGLPNLIISGIIWNSTRPQAIVNGNIVEVGDRLFKVPTDNKELIPELKFVDISKEGLAVAYEDKIVIIKPELQKE